MNFLTPSEKIESDKAYDFIKNNKNEFLSKFANSNLYFSESKPVSVFMAGSPGAGKTETSRRLIETFKIKPLIIDADEIRKFIPGYDGLKAYIYQHAADKGINFLLDYALKNNLNFLLDGTFAYGGVIDNVQRSLNHHRTVDIWFVYQHPQRAWEMVLAREVKEHRRVSKEVFLKAFVTSQQNVNMIKKTFDDKVKLNLLIKDFDTGEKRITENIDSIDQYLPKIYTEEELRQII